MDRLRAAVDRVLSWFLIALMFVAVINVLWQVVTRWMLDAPSPYTEELARYLLIWIGLVGAAYAAGKKMHLAIDLLPNMLDGKKRWLLETVIDSCILLFAFFVLVVGGYRLMRLTLMMGQTSAALGVQLGYVYAALPVSGIIIAFYALVSIRNRLPGMRGPSPRPAESDRASHQPID